VNNAVGRVEIGAAGALKIGADLNTANFTNPATVGWPRQTLSWRV
jgi:hypothetical protein